MMGRRKDEAMYNLKCTSIILTIMGLAFGLLPATLAGEVTSPTQIVTRKGDTGKIGFVVPAELKSLPMAPDFQLKDAKGKTWRLEDFRGQVVLLNFFASWCPPCRVEAPHLRELNAKYGGKGVKVVGIVLEPYGKAAVDYVTEKWGLQYLILIGDEAVAIDYGAIGIPRTLLLTPDLRIYATYDGYHSKEDFEADIVKLLKVLGQEAKQ
jgi:peroxiredoxin